MQKILPAVCCSAVLPAPGTGRDLEFLERVIGTVAIAFVRHIQGVPGSSAGCPADSRTYRLSYRYAPMLRERADSVPQAG